MSAAYTLVKRPLMTEKSTHDQEGKVPVRQVNKGAAQRSAYHFAVPVHANKVEIKQAIELLFSVEVIKVNTITKRGKRVRRGWISSRKSDWKKAIVTLAPGQAIEFV
ncbi:MAG: 50S ribosomal protein L23 [Planctomycetes bacterium]|nr:50S ribosomal protein L23 [Planctomycetota bacterium]